MHRQYSERESQVEAKCIQVPFGRAWLGGQWEQFARSLISFTSTPTPTFESAPTLESTPTIPTLH